MTKTCLEIIGNLILIDKKKMKYLIYHFGQFLWKLKYASPHQSNPMCVQ